MSSSVPSPRWGEGQGEGPGAPRLRRPLRQFLQHFDAAFERLVLGGVRNTEVRISITEDVAGDDQQIVLDRRFDELGPRAPRSFDEQIERAAGAVNLEVIAEFLQHEVTLLAVLVDAG